MADAITIHTIWRTRTILTELLPTHQQVFRLRGLSPESRCNNDSNDMADQNDFDEIATHQPTAAPIAGTVPAWVVQ